MPIEKSFQIPEFGQVMIFLGNGLPFYFVYSRLNNINNNNNDDDDKKYYRLFPSTPIFSDYSVMSDFIITQKSETSSVFTTEVLPRGLVKFTEMDMQFTDYVKATLVMGVEADDITVTRNILFVGKSLSAFNKFKDMLLPTQFKKSDKIPCNANLNPIFLTMPPPIGVVDFNRPMLTVNGITGNPMMIHTDSSGLVTKMEWVDGLVLFLDLKKEDDSLKSYEEVKNEMMEVFPHTIETHNIPVYLVIINFDVNLTLSPEQNRVLNQFQCHLFLPYFDSRNYIYSPFVHAFFRKMMSYLL